MEVFGVGPNEVTSEMRRNAKVINFGIIYGMGPHGLSEQLGKSRAECKEFIDRFSSGSRRFALTWIPACNSDAIMGMCKRSWVDGNITRI